MLKWQYKTSNKNHTRAFAQDLSYQFALIICLFLINLYINPNRIIDYSVGPMVTGYTVSNRFLV